MRVHLTQTNVNDAIEALEAFSSSLQQAAGHAEVTFGASYALQVRDMRLQRGRVIALVRKLKAARTDMARKMEEQVTPCQKKEA